MKYTLGCVIMILNMVGLNTFAADVPAPTVGVVQAMISTTEQIRKCPARANFFHEIPYDSNCTDALIAANIELYNRFVPKSYEMVARLKSIQDCPYYTRYLNSMKLYDSLCVDPIVSDVTAKLKVLEKSAKPD